MAYSLIACSRKSMGLRHSSCPRSHIPLHSHLSGPINYPVCQRIDSTVRHFNQVYISSIVARLRTQASGQLPQPLQPQAQPHQPTEADYQALLASITSETSVINTETMSILPQFSHTSGAELEAHHVPQHIITFVEQNREHLQRAAQDQNGLRFPSAGDIHPDATVDPRCLYPDPASSDT